MTRPYDIAEISNMLAGRIDALCHELLPAGRRHGSEWVEASTRQGGLGDSLRVHLTGNKAGVWSHFAANEAGDPIDLVAYMRGCSKGEAVKWARAWLGLDVADPETAMRMHHEAEDRRRKAVHQAAADAEKRRKRAQAIFLAGRPKLKGTPVDLYLKGRGIDLDQLGRQPASLRYLADCYCQEIDRKVPAMVAAICGPDGKTMAVHRTYLATADPARVTKAPLNAAKKVYGDFRCGSIRLWRGESVDPRTGEIKNLPLAKAPPGSEVLICEGIEDGLSLALACPEMRILCAVSLANMANVALPDTISTVILVADNDGAGTAADRGLNRAIEAHLAAGREVKIARPPSDVKDMNELLNQKDGAA